MELTVEKLIGLRNAATAHYDTMILGAEYFIRKKHEYKPDDLFYYLRETYGSRDCWFCRYYDSSIECILTKKNTTIGESCGGYLYCCEGLWNIMDDSQSWEEWIPRAWAVRQFIVKRVDEEIAKMEKAA